MLHSVTNYELHKGIYSAHNSHNYFEMAHTLRRLFGEYGLCRDAVLYNFVDNHDVDRIIDKLAVPEDLFPVYMFLFTIQGIPSIYYGSEFGIHGQKVNGSDVLYYISTFLGAFILVRNFMHLKMCKNYRQSNG